MDDVTAEALLPPDNKIDLVDLTNRFLRRLPIFLTVAAVIMAAIVAFTLTRVPTYTATASVVIEPRRTEVLKEDPVVGDMPRDAEAIDTEVVILNSEALAERVVRRFNLQNDPEFNPPPEPGDKVTPEPATGGPQLSPEEAAIKRAARAIQAATEVKRNGLTYVIDVSFTALDPKKAASIANAQVEEYVTSQMETNIGATRGASQWLQGRLSDLQAEVQRNESALQQFIIANDLMSSSGATMAEQEVSTLNQQIAVAAADLAEKRARFATAREQVSRGGGGGDVAAVQGSDTVQQLRRQQAELAVSLADLETRYGPLHPSVQKTKQQIATIDSEIVAEIRRVLSAQEAEVRVAEQRYASLLSSRGRAEGALGSNNRSVVGLNELQRKVEASRAVYQAFLSRAKETAAQEGLQRPDSRVSARARPPGSPTSPNKSLNFALGFVFAIVAGGGAVLLVETLDSGMRSSADVQARLKIPTLAVVPLVKLPANQLNRAVVDKPFSAFSEAFRGLKRSIWAATKEKNQRSIAFTSALPDEGKTMTCLAFGRSVARGGVRTLIIDADLRRRALTEATHLQVTHGLIEVLEGKIAMERVIVQDPLSGAYLLMLADAPPPERDLFDGAAWPSLLMECKQHGFDAIVVDTAPVLGIADTRGIAFHADAVIMIVRWVKTPKQAARAALALLESAGANVIGACLTMVDHAKHTSNSYADAASYNKAFKKYYVE